MTGAQLIGSLVFLGMGVLLVLLGVLWTVGTVRVLRNGIRTHAKIVDYEEAMDMGRGIAVVEFRDHANVTRRICLSFAGGGRLGTMVKIIYDRDNPLGVVRDSFLGLWAMAIMPIGIGGMFLLCGGLGLVAKRAVE